MHTLMVLYGQPTDPDQFREYYQNTHLSIAHKLPGVRASRHSVNLAAAEGESPFIAVFEADFDSAEAMAEALSSPEGAEAVADLPNFATGGVQIVHFAAVVS
ncbi:MULTISPECIES: EthD family reductase [unclassified Rhodococcus (in: high G+C Gram-positive bacteria)]|uniref:EthD family reductase n=1 Tax=unclassified Rhodococcus (in: high G+C Gram-positive bacteria) TaxID=192944 RepID=UPI00163AF627|nr:MULTISPECIES: EthD family reductase [unclassified Rhodococcus (in: high G+C Gram-positive bacteria)]MBC2637871.1 EthD family reductase [Rhodococcus sp. 3A]MBC2897381.1 EthD family reductase [Rhodococcus sp. 4CII]